jgi:hypothetical protein
VSERRCLCLLFAAGYLLATHLGPTLLLQAVGVLPLLAVPSPLLAPVPLLLLQSGGGSPKSPRGKKK